MAVPLLPIAQRTKIKDLRVCHGLPRQTAKALNQLLGSFSSREPAPTVNSETGCGKIFSEVSDGVLYYVPL